MPTEFEWIQLLEARIEEQKRYALPFECRYANEYVLPFIAQEYREVYGNRSDHLLLSLLEAPRTGAAAVTVDALVERLTLLGGTSDDKDTALGITQAWEDNDLDVMHREAHREALVRREGFGMVSKAVDGRRAVFTIESSEQCAVHRMQGPPYDVDVAFKRSVDEWTGEERGLLRLPGKDVFLVPGQTEIPPGTRGEQAAGRWKIEREVATGTNVVQVVQFAHQPRLRKPPVSEIEAIVTLVDEVDLIEGLMVFAGHFGAVPIRYGTGIDVQRDPKDPTKPLLGPDGKALMGFKPRADHFWFTSKPDGKFGQLTPATLDTFVAWANHARTNLRAKTKVASTYYAIDLKTHMSAELLKTDEAPMVRRVLAIGRDGTFNQAWRRGLTMIAEAQGLHGRVRPVWADPQTRMDAQAVDAFGKAVVGGLGIVTAAEKFLGWTRTEAEQAVEEARQERADQAAAEPDPFALLDPSTRARLKSVPPIAGTGGAA